MRMTTPSGITLTVIASTILLLSACGGRTPDKNGPAGNQNSNVQPVSDSVNEKLIKGTAEYYGMQDSISTFVTCDGTHIEIGDGHVVSSNKPCGPSTSGRPVALFKRIEGSVTGVDHDKGIVEIKPTGSDKAVKFFLPQTALSQKEELQSIKPGDQIKVTSFLPGRAERLEKAK
jgi:hypothetical protein